MIKCFGLGLKHLLGVEEKGWFCRTVFCKMQQPNTKSFLFVHSQYKVVRRNSFCMNRAASTLWVIFWLETKKHLAVWSCMYALDIMWFYDWKITWVTGADVSSTSLRIHESACSCITCICMYIRLQAGGILVQVVSWWIHTIHIRRNNI